MAATLGEVFDDSLIENINFFPQLETDSIKKSLEKLSLLGIIESLGPQEECRPFRFVHPIIRYLIYEKMLFQHRRTVHKQYREYFKIHPVPDYLFYEMPNEVKSIAEENFLFYHFRNSNPPKNDSKYLDVPASNQETADRCHQSRCHSLSPLKRATERFKSHLDLCFPQVEC